MDITRYFIFLSFRGTDFKGWQVQPGESTVQGLLEEALSTLLREKIEVTGAGRTDAGVHASHYVAHFDCGDLIDDPGNIIFRLNNILPGSIAISRLIRVRRDAHARFDAVSRTYRYFISLRKDPFKVGLVTRIGSEPDIERMNLASEYMMTYTDFTSFSKLHTDVKTNNCTILSAGWVKENDMIIFEIRADRFLRNMVRAIVGTQLDIGSGRLEPEAIKEIIEAKDRGKAGKSVSPDGLYLAAIEYPADLFVV